MQKSPQSLSLSLLCAAALSTSLFCANASAGDNGTVYTQLGTNGAVLGYAKSISDDFSLRGQYSYLPSISYNGNVGDFGVGSATVAKLNWSTFSLLGDWYPLDSASGFHLTAGIASVSSEFTADVTNATVSGISNLSAHADVKLANSTVPYIGLGYMTRPKNASGWGFTLDAGVMFMDPSVSLTTSGAVTPTQSEIDSQKQSISDAVNQLRNYPVISLGVSYSF